MSRYIVTRVRREWSSDYTHRHIEGVCTADGVHHSRSAVFGSISGGNVWTTRAGGYHATIRVLSFCPRPDCLATPYIKTKPDSTLLDNLEDLPEC